MKKAWILTGALFLTACSPAEKPVSSLPSETPETEEKETGIWSVWPDKEYGSVQPAVQENYELVETDTESFGKKTVFVQAEGIGYPSEWQQSGYEENAVLVTSGNRQGILDYEGNEIYPVEISLLETPFSQGVVSGFRKDGTPAVGYVDSSSSQAEIFSTDFSEVQSVPQEDFSFAEDESSSDGHPFLSWMNDGLVLAGMTYSESGSQTGWKYEPYTGTFDTEIIVPVLDSSFQETGMVILNEQGQKTADVNSEMPLRNGSYVNGFYVISDSNYASVVQASTGIVMARQYQDAGFFEDGYIPVKKYGRWGYLDENGIPVTDFIFDNAGTLCNGKAYVSYEGKYGVLDVKKILEDSQINISTVDPDSDAEKKGRLKVLVDDLSIRDGISGTQIGNAMPGSVYDYYETQEQDGCTWYRISRNGWIGDQGGWLEKEQ